MIESELAVAAAEYRALLSEMLALRGEVLEDAAQRLRWYAWADADGTYAVSARNLADYLALRCRDLRPLQLRLARQGLSSLGRVEAHVLASIDQVIGVLAVLCDQPVPPLEPAATPGFDAGNDLLTLNTRNVFGPPQPRRTARIMVTMPSEAASNEALVRALLESGMDCARINCAHDDLPVWRHMIENIRRAEASVGRGCRILMDLAGHKLRTGPLEDAPASTRLRPRRSAAAGGREPLTVALVTAAAHHALPDGLADVCLVAEEWVLAAMKAGDRLQFTDLRGRNRRLVAERDLEGLGWLVHCSRTSVIGPATAMRLMRRQNGRWTRVADDSVHLSGHRRLPVKIRLHLGDALQLTGPELPGRPPLRDAEGNEREPARIGITAPRVLSRLHPGQAVWIDDGRLGAVVESTGPDFVALRVTHAPPDGFRLRADKGINLPGAELGLGPLSRKDLADLDFVVRHADLVGFSFVESAGDMRVLMEELKRRGAGALAIVAKIETGRALRNLPEIMLSTIGRYPLAIMIARGDLAVEVGGERLAEIQEEILWLAEGGHVPVIWATQVLETMAKTGAVSRPELSDAAMSVRAECVMLNKGPFIVSALRTLDRILHRMQDHQQKKMPQLRALNLAVAQDPPLV
ncbi:pyruvate kinase [Thioalkalivibrio sp.]|uniref:pyruvate kinase n=3 Tax=Thioalkalivibrio sp. TaxID=2093813 RepID=UPI003563DED9